MFERIGGFADIDFGEDDEFNYRLGDMGGKIYLTPKIRSIYHTRSSLPALFRQYRSYGRAKVRVLRRHPAQARLRQFVPASFVGVLGGLSLTSRCAAAAIGALRSTVPAGDIVGRCVSRRGQLAVRARAAAGVRLPACVVRLGFLSRYRATMADIDTRPALGGDDMTAQPADKQFESALLPARHQRREIAGSSTPSAPAADDRLKTRLFEERSRIRREQTCRRVSSCTLDCTMLMPAESAGRQ
jgi:hypothetical protein